MAVYKSRNSIVDLMNIKPDYANLKVNNSIEKVSPESVKIGDLIIVKPVEKVPLDGKIIEGNSTFDTSTLTGESIPRDIISGDEVLSGYINISSLITIKVSKPFYESTISKILDFQSISIISSFINEIEYSKLSLKCFKSLNLYK